MNIITFCDANMTISAVNLKATAIAVMPGCTVSIFNQSDFDRCFARDNSNILTQPRGAGYWLWKPYIINTALHALADGEILVYCDAGLSFLTNLDTLLQKMDQDIYMFGNKYRHGDWCKMDCLIEMNANTSDILNHEQAQASVLIIKKTAFSVNFIRKWLLYAQMPGMIDDSPSKATNYAGFQEHRHDQAILTNLAIQAGLKFHWWPVQYMRRHKDKYPNDNPTLIWEHHRKRNNEW